MVGPTDSTTARADDPRINQLRHEIEELRRQEPATIKAIEAHYDSIIHKDKMSEKEYMAAHAEADAAYAKAIQALIDEIKKSS